MQQGRSQAWECPCIRRVHIVSIGTYFVDAGAVRTLEIVPRRPGAGERGVILASCEAMSRADSSRFPVTVTRLPLTRCEICGRTLAYQPGQASAVLTKHYLRMHPEALSEAAEATGS
jgi:hypothetical protein